MKDILLFDISSTQSVGTLSYLQDTLSPASERLLRTPGEVVLLTYLEEEPMVMISSTFKAYQFP